MVLCVHLVLQGMGPASESRVSQKVEDPPPLYPRGLTTRSSRASQLGGQAQAKAGTLPKPQQLCPGGLANILEKLVTVLGNCSEREMLLEPRGTGLCFNESFHSEIYVEEIWLLNPDFLLA